MSTSQEKSLAERMKENYELRSASYLPRRTYSIIRLDGRAFHSFTRRIGSSKTYDEDLMSRMDLTARYLCGNIQGAKFAYIQSDEISILLTDFDNVKTESWYGGNVQKIVSVSASMASAFFNSIPSGKFGRTAYEHVDKYTAMDVNDWVLTAETELATFDSRVFTIPDKVEVANYFHWRVADWERNSIQMLARYHYPQSELHGKGWSELHEMIHKAGDNWSKQPDSIKRGRLCSAHVGGMWSIMAMPDLHSEDGKKMLSGLIPVHGY